MTCACDRDARPAGLIRKKCNFETVSGGKVRPPGLSLGRNVRASRPGVGGRCAARPHPYAWGRALARTLVTRLSRQPGPEQQQSLPWRRWSCVFALILIRCPFSLFASSPGPMRPLARRGCGWPASRRSFSFHALSGSRAAQSMRGTAS